MAAPAGWYVDPQNPQLMRFFDGQNWTTQTQPAAQAAPAQSPTTPSPTTPQPGQQRAWQGQNGQQASQSEPGVSYQHPGRKAAGQQPDAAQQGVTQPGAAQPGAIQPGTSLPGGYGQPAAQGYGQQPGQPSRPGFGQPGFQPGFQPGGPGQQPGVGQPGFQQGTQPGTQQPAGGFQFGGGQQIPTEDRPATAKTPRGVKMALAGAAVGIAAIMGIGIAMSDDSVEGGLSASDLGLPGGFDCDALAKEAVALSADDEASLQLISATGMSETKNRIGKVVVPEDGEKELVMACSGDGVWGDGTETSLKLQLTLDSFEELYVEYAGS